MIFSKLYEERLKLSGGRSDNNLSSFSHSLDKTSKMSKIDKELLQKYISYSKDLNSSLIKNGNDSQLYGENKAMHKAIMHNSKPLGREVHLYSGTNHDFGKMAKESKNGIIVSPAHLSTTHDLNIAKFFSSIKTPVGKDHHMIHIHAKPTDKGLHLSGLSKVMSKEHETILPAGTRLKYSHTSNHLLDTNKGTKENFKVHHFTIDSQGTNK